MTDMPQFAFAHTGAMCSPEDWLNTDFDPEKCMMSNGKLKLPKQ